MVWRSCSRRLARVVCAVTTLYTLNGRAGEKLAWMMADMRWLHRSTRRSWTKDRISSTLSSAALTQAAVSAAIVALSSAVYSGCPCSDLTLLWNWSRSLLSSAGSRMEMNVVDIFFGCLFVVFCGGFDFFEVLFFWFWSKKKQRTPIGSETASIFGGALGSVAFHWNVILRRKQSEARTQGRMEVR